MDLCIDIGNSNTVLGVFDGDRLVHRWRIATDSGMTRHNILATVAALFLAGELRFSSIGTVTVSSVVPGWNHSWERFVREHISDQPVFLMPEESRTGIAVALDDASQLGADRIANAVAANTLYPGGSIIVDSGTAITLDVVSPEAEYLGGIILPGLHISLDALSGKTAKLPRVRLERPETALGKNTVKSLQSGMYFGFAGMIDRCIDELMTELDFTPSVIATGGVAGGLTEASRNIEQFRRDLTLTGLHIFARKIRRSHVENRGE